MSWKTAGREFKVDSEVYRVARVLALKLDGDGDAWAKVVARICRVSRESVYQWVERGFIPTSRYVALLMEAAAGVGCEASLRALSGVEDEPRTGSDPEEERGTSRKVDAVEREAGERSEDPQPASRPAAA